MSDLQVVRHEGAFAAKALHDKQLKSVGVPSISEMSARYACELPNAHLMVHIVAIDGCSDQI